MKNLIHYQAEAIAELNNLVEKVEQMKYNAEIREVDIDVWPIYQRIDILELQIEARAEMMDRTPYYKAELKCEED